MDLLKAKKGLSANIGTREALILYARGAEVVKTSTIGVYKVESGNGEFSFTYGNKDYPNFTIIG